LPRREGASRSLSTRGEMLVLVIFGQPIAE
jgi:hypothetical protein